MTTFIKNNDYRNIYNYIKYGTMYTESDFKNEDRYKLYQALTEQTGGTIAITGEDDNYTAVNSASYTDVLSFADKSGNTNFVWNFENTDTILNITFSAISGLNAIAGATRMDYKLFIKVNSGVWQEIHENVLINSNNAQDESRRTVKTIFDFSTLATAPQKGDNTEFKIQSRSAFANTFVKFNQTLLATSTPAYIKIDNDTQEN